jgi:hypothetical protein
MKSCSRLFKEQKSRQKVVANGRFTVETRPICRQCSAANIRQNARSDWSSDLRV